MLDEIKEFRKEITYVVTQKADDVCWLDAYVKLGKLVGIEITVESLALLPKGVFLDNCEHYIDCLKKGEKYITPNSAQFSKFY